MGLSFGTSGTVGVAIGEKLVIFDSYEVSITLASRLIAPGVFLWILGLKM